jgi:mRNA interferase MazF
MSDALPRGTIVLVPFPFTDLSADKLRPAVVVSAARLQGTDVCVAFISSRIPSPLLADALVIEDVYPDFAKTGLKTTSVIHAGKIATLDRKVFLGELGRLPSSLLKKLDDKLRFALGL